MTYFGTNLKKIRQIKGLSQQAFAELIDLNRGVISSYEEGRAEPKIETLLRIANYFGISTDEIISKPLTVNQLANFSLIEDSMVIPAESKPFELNELNPDGTKQLTEFQKIATLFDVIHVVDEVLAAKSRFKENTVLFLKEIKAISESFSEFVVVVDEKIIITNTPVSNTLNYAIVGYIGNERANDTTTILERLALLEKKVFGK